MHPLFLVGMLFLTQAPASPAPAPASAGDELAAEVQRAVAAYNARDLAYYQAALDPKSVYIAEDGGVMAGRDRVLRPSVRFFPSDPPRRTEIADLSVERRGDTGWATFRWTLTAGPDVRQGVTTVVYARSEGAWRPMIIQNTLRAHAMRPAAPGASAAP